VRKIQNQSVPPAEKAGGVFYGPALPHRGRADGSRFLREKPFRDMIFRKDMMNKRPALYGAGRRPA